MARPRKPASLKEGKSETKKHLDSRLEYEKELAGSSSDIHDIPEILDEGGVVYYQYLIRELENSGVLSNLDIPLLTQTADTLSKMDQCDRIINESGVLWSTYDKNGEELLKEHPTVNTKQKYLNQFRALSTQLGLSPASRASLAEVNMKVEQDNKDPLLRILDKKEG